MTQPPIMFTLPPELEGKVEIIVHVETTYVPPQPRTRRQKLIDSYLPLAIPVVCIVAFVAALAVVRYFTKGHL